MYWCWQQPCDIVTVGLWLNSTADQCAVGAVCGASFAKRRKRDYLNVEGMCQGDTFTRTYAALFPTLTYSQCVIFTPTEGCVTAHMNTHFLSFIPLVFFILVVLYYRSTLYNSVGVDYLHTPISDSVFLFLFNLVTCLFLEDGVFLQNLFERHNFFFSYSTCFFFVLRQYIFYCLQRPQLTAFYGYVCIDHKI